MTTSDKSYRELQATVKDFRDNHGYELTCRLNARREVLETELERIMDLAGDDGTLEAIAYQADIDNGVITYDATDFCPLTCEVKIKSFCFVDDEIHTVEPNNTDNLTEQAELEAVEPETVNVISKPNQALNRNFESGSSVMFLLTPIAMLVAGMLMAGLWVITSFSTVLIALVKFLMPRIDKGLTKVLLGFVAVVELIFGSDYDEYADSYLEIKHLMR